MNRKSRVSSGQTFPATGPPVMADDTSAQAPQTDGLQPQAQQADALQPDPKQPEPDSPEASVPELSGTDAAQPEVATVVAATLEVPPLPIGAGGGEQGGDGGEWDLLTTKLRTWLASGELQRLWAQTRTPLSAAAALITLLVVLRIYTALLGAIEGLPLVPGLLELVGVIWLARHGMPRLVRTSERQQLIDALNQRWQAFRGQR